MSITLRKELVIGPGGMIEINSSDLPVGSQAEVIVRLKTPSRRKAPARPAPTTKPNDPGWSPGFFELAGCLPDFPERAAQDEYEIRDEPLCCSL